VTCQVWNPIIPFLLLISFQQHRWSPKSCFRFRKVIEVWWETFRFTPYIRAGGSPLVGHQSLFRRYTHLYSPYVKYSPSALYLRKQDHYIKYMPATIQDFIRSVANSCVWTHNLLIRSRNSAVDILTELLAWLVKAVGSTPGTRNKSLFSSQQTDLLRGPLNLPQCGRTAFIIQHYMNSVSNIKEQGA